MLRVGYVMGQVMQLPLLWLSLLLSVLLDCVSNASHFSSYQMLLGCHTVDLSQPLSTFI